MTFSIMTFSIMTFSIMAFSIMVFSIMAFSIMTFSIMTICMRIKNCTVYENDSVLVVTVIYAECHVFNMRTVFMLNVVMLFVAKLCPHNYSYK